eukprot:CAMPEP_0194326908 /NCGR_PEP_ID=MMETSP0171-20130528/38805_1 /TAXON_ID=218684 /ORGANISM="Corethron pennatum, Strain L29A3" /LENGTH=64 /DNA_ID=CAMNT_0039086661 /DNA_START=30 /DNA_END=220 /DNA_ORIENTATION=-
MAAPRRRCSTNGIRPCAALLRLAFLAAAAALAPSTHRPAQQLQRPSTTDPAAFRVPHAHRRGPG